MSSPINADLRRAERRALFAAAAVSVATSVHHVYGAIVYHTPWRYHAVAVSAGAFALILGEKRPEFHQRALGNRARARHSAFRCRADAHSPRAGALDRALRALAPGVGGHGSGPPARAFRHLGARWPGARERGESHRIAARRNGPACCELSTASFAAASCRFRSLSFDIR